MWKFKTTNTKKYPLIEFIVDVRCYFLAQAINRIISSTFEPTDVKVKFKSTTERDSLQQYVDGDGKVHVNQKYRVWSYFCHTKCGYVEGQVVGSFHWHQLRCHLVQTSLFRDATIPTPEPKPIDWSALYNPPNTLTVATTSAKEDKPITEEKDEDEEGLATKRQEKD
eukprot:TRINITY_DN42159_c0_g1_i3.p1 TRINITY_DN42159_c0_g1~~TRINITY_DN42159_c0_g1_i3.p1  ORF type:complete len:167 (-),score=12.76 TRINITY_DN42159_c0_g1_i3:50-550(-)